MIRMCLLLATVFGLLASSQGDRGPSSGSAAAKETPATDPQETRNQVDTQWRLQFRLDQIRLPRNGKGAVVVAGELKNAGGRTLLALEAEAASGLADGLRFWEVGTPYVYYAEDAPGVSGTPLPGEFTVAPNSARRVRGGIDMTMDRMPGPLAWFTRTRSDRFDSGQNSEHLAKLPPGLYGVSCEFRLHAMSPDPKVGIAGDTPIDVHSQNMLWIEVRTDGSAVPLTTRPAL